MDSHQGFALIDIEGKYELKDTSLKSGGEKKNSCPFNELNIQVY